MIKWVILMLVCAMCITGCGGNKENRIPNTSKFAQEKKLELKQIEALFVNNKVDQPIALNREQIGSNRSEDDPVELVYKRGENTEQITVGLFFAPEDAQASVVDNEKSFVDRDPRQLKLIRVKRYCNSVMFYFPGTDLTNLQLQDTAKKIEADLKTLCKTGKVPTAAVATKE